MVYLMNRECSLLNDQISLLVTVKYVKEKKSLFFIVYLKFSNSVTWNSE